MTVLLVLLNKIPEGNVIARRVLNACKNTLCAQTSKHLPRKLSVNADRNVIRKQRCVQLLVKDAEVLLNISWAAKCVERSGCYKSVCTQCEGTTTVLQDALGLGINDAHKNRNAVVNNADSLANNLITTLISCKDNLARRAEEE